MYVNIFNRHAQYLINYFFKINNFRHLVFSLQNFIRSTLHSGCHGSCQKTNDFATAPPETFICSLALHFAYKISHIMYSGHSGPARILSVKIGFSSKRDTFSHLGKCDKMSFLIAQNVAQPIKKILLELILVWKKISPSVAFVSSESTL
jgi:hypothetical protein